MRFPDAIWRPTDKHGYGDFDAHSQKGVVIHSAEGSFAGAMSVLDGPRQASWHFFIADTGHVYQHVDSDQIAWTNGSYDANRLFWGIECEGSAGEALTELQYQALVKIVRWLWATYQVGALVRQETLWEHNEMTRFGSASTSCPSGRIPWARLINEWEDDMDEDRIREIIAEELTKVFKGRDPGDLARYITSDPDLRHAIEQVARGVSGGGHPHEATVSSKVTLA